MKKLVVLLVLAAFALSGCASGKFLGFLATTGYADAQAKAAQDKAGADAKVLLDQQAAEIEQLKQQLAGYQSVKDQAQAAIDQVAKTTDTVQQLQTIASQAEARISAIPREVIKQIVDILQAALK